MFLLTIGRLNGRSVTGYASYWLFLLLVGCSLAAVSFASDPKKELVPPEWQWLPIFTVPLLTGDQQSDGVLAEEEWKYATQIGALLDANTLMQTSEPARFLISRRGLDLCLAFEFSRPKTSGRPRVTVKDKGWSAAPLWGTDDNVEVWLAPCTRDVRMDGMMDPRYAIAGNSAGAYSQDMTGWDRAAIPRAVQYGSIVHDEKWQGEMRLPWTVIKNIRAAQPVRVPAPNVQWKSSFFFHQVTPFHALIGPQQMLGAFPTLQFSDRPVGFEASGLEMLKAGQARFVVGVRNGSEQNVTYQSRY